MPTNSVFEIRIKVVQIPNEMGLNGIIVLDGYFEPAKFPRLFVDKINYLVKCFHTKFS